MSSFLIGIAAIAAMVLLFLKFRPKPQPAPVVIVPDKASKRDRPCPRCQYTLGYKPAPCRKCRIYPQPDQA